MKITTKLLLPILLALLTSSALCQEMLKLSGLNVDSGALVDLGDTRSIYCRANLSNDGHSAAVNLTLRVVLQNGYGQALQTWDKKIDTLEPGKSLNYVSPFYYDRSGCILQMKAQVLSSEGKTLSEQSWTLPPVGEKPNGY